MKKALVIGGGFTGCTWAHLLAKKEFKVTLVERAPFLGGGCKTFTYGGHPYTLGPRHLFTPHEHIYQFLNDFTPLRRLRHYLLTYVEQDGHFYSYPPHEDDLDGMPDKEEIRGQIANRNDPGSARNFKEYWIYSAGEKLYEKFVKNYSHKMWQIESNVALDDFRFDGKGVQLRSGTKEVRPDWFIAYPLKLNGWDDYFELTTADPNIEVRLNSQIDNYDLTDKRVQVGGEWVGADLVISTVSPDIWVDFAYGELPYIGRDLLKLVLPVEHVIPDPIFFLHYAGEEAFTRVVEYKKLTGYVAPTTFLGIEIPSKNNKLYPYPIKAEQEKAERCIKDFPDGVWSVGRMGNYRYLDIADVIGEALEKVENV